MNPLTIQKLSENGSNLQEPHILWSAVHVFSESDVDPLMVALEAAGYEVQKPAEAKVYQETRYWLVTPSLALVPTVEVVGRMTDELVTIVSEFEAEYDGWYTEVVPRIL